MKKILFLCFATLISGVVFSQQISVESFSCLENDLNARASKVKDCNGELCALLIINTTEKGFEFSGCSIEKTEQKTGEIWVFVSPGVKFITLKHRDFGTLRNYLFPQSIKSGTTYEMILKTQAPPPSIDSASMMRAMEQKLLELEQRLTQANKQQTNKTTNFQHLKTLTGYSKGITCVAYSSDGKHIVSGSDDACVRIWDVNTGICIKNIEGIINDAGGNWCKNFEGHLSAVTSVAYSPDGSHIISGSQDGIIKIWDANTGKFIKTIVGHSNPISSVKYSPDGSRFISGSWDGTIKIWGASSGLCYKILEGHTDDVYSVSYSPDGSRIVSCSRIRRNNSIVGIIKIWDANTGACLKTLIENDDIFYSVAFSPDGSRIISGSKNEIIKIWDANTGQCIKTLEGHTDDVYSVAYNPDGSRIVSCSGIRRNNSTVGIIKIWDANTGKCLQTIEDYTGFVISVAFSPDGSRIVSVSEDGTIKIWEE